MAADRMTVAALAARRSTDDHSHIRHSRSTKLAFIGFACTCVIVLVIMLVAVAQPRPWAPLYDSESYGAEKVDLPMMDATLDQVDDQGQHALPAYPTLIVRANQWKPVTIVATKCTTDQTTTHGQKWFAERIPPGWVSAPIPTAPTLRLTGCTEAIRYVTDVPPDVRAKVQDTYTQLGYNTTVWSVAGEVTPDAPIGHYGVIQRWATVNFAIRWEPGGGP